MQLWAVLYLLTTENSLYMFRTLSAPIIRSTKTVVAKRPIIRSTKTVVAATRACRGSGWYISSKDVQGRSRPMTRTSGCYYSF